MPERPRAETPLPLLHLDLVVPRMDPLPRRKFIHQFKVVMVEAYKRKYMYSHKGKHSHISLMVKWKQVRSNAVAVKTSNFWQRPGNCNKW